MALLEVKNLYVSYGAIRALHGVSFYVERGEVVTLIGANGAGKSTTLRALSGLQPADSGSIYYDGVDITRKQASDIVTMGIIQVRRAAYFRASHRAREFRDGRVYVRQSRD